MKWTDYGPSACGLVFPTLSDEPESPKEPNISLAKQTFEHFADFLSNLQTDYAS